MSMLHTPEHIHELPPTAAQLIDAREQRAMALTAFCNAYESTVPAGTPPPPELLLRMRELFALESNDAATVRLIPFVIDAFRGLQRRDGSPLATHSLELFLKAKSFGIDDPEVLATVLVHDVSEDSVTKTLDDVARMGDAIGQPRLHAFARTMTEHRESGNRDFDLVQFVDQLRAATSVPADKRHVIVLAELLDRIDDLSTTAYLITQLSDADRAPEARTALVIKLAKCRYTVDRIIAGVEHPDVLRVRRAFDALVAYHQQIVGISDTEITETQRDRYGAQE